MDFLPYSPIFCTSWNNLPTEIKIMIIEKLGRSGRDSLRLCSTKDQELVDSVVFRTLYLMRLIETGYSYKIMVQVKFDGSTESFEFRSFHEFQAGLVEILDYTHNVQRMEIYGSGFLTRTGNNLKLSSDGKLVKIEQLLFFPLYVEHDDSQPILDAFLIRLLTFAGSSSSPFEILEQISPLHLEKFQWKIETEISNFFDMHQVINAGVIHAEGGSIEDQQLLRLKCYEIILKNPSKLTSGGIKAFIQKCVKNLERKPVLFTFSYDGKNRQPRGIFKELENVVTMNFNSLTQFQQIRISSSHLKYVLEVDCIPGRINGKTVSMDSLYRHFKIYRPLSLLDYEAKSIRKVEYMEVVCHETKTVLIIRHYNCAQVFHEFYTVESLQAKLTKELTKTDYIEEFFLNEWNHDWNLYVPKKDIITVRKLVLNRNKSYFLNQFGSFKVEDYEFRGRIVESNDENISQSHDVRLW